MVDRGSARPRHDWRFVEGHWRCQRCLRCINGGGDDKPRPPGGICGGRVAEKLVQGAEDKGHRMAVAEGEAMPVWFCLRCGAWLSRRAFGLRKECKGKPTGAGKQALANVAKGKHPWRRPGTDEAQRAKLAVRRKTFKSRLGTTVYARVTAEAAAAEGRRDIEIRRSRTQGWLTS